MIKIYVKVFTRVYSKEYDLVLVSTYFGSTYTTVWYVDTYFLCHWEKNKVSKLVLPKLPVGESYPIKTIPHAGRAPGR